eukprot:jgi/Mesen1/1519/ME000132S00454
MSPVIPQQPVPMRPANMNGGGRRRSDREAQGGGPGGPSRSDQSSWRSTGQNPPASSVKPNSGPAPGFGPGSSSSAAGGGARGAAAAPAAEGAPGQGRAHERGDAAGGGGSSAGGKGGGGSSSAHAALQKASPQEKLLVLASCLTGQLVEVTVKSGSVYSGIFHAAAAERDFGVTLKMARLVRDGGGAKSVAVKEAARKPPAKSLVVSGKDFVQILAKDVAYGTDSLQNGRMRGDHKGGEIATDTGISRGGRLGGEERELKPWMPEAGEEQHPGGNVQLDSTFSGPVDRHWDQFKLNEEKYGVKSTYYEEFYTTKLKKPSREMEREAARIAREIEGKTSRNVHLAEERGQRLAPEVEALDEESRFSSVMRQGSEHGDSGGEEEEDEGEGEGEGEAADEYNDDTFGDAPPEDLQTPPATTPTREGPPHALGGGSQPPETGAKSGFDAAHVAAATAGDGEKETGASLQERRAATAGAGAVADSGDFQQKMHLRLRLLPKRTSKGGQSSPYHSPVGRRSPLMSPLVADAASIQALNLDPSCPHVPEQVYREFHEFKERSQSQKGKKQREDHVNALKSFSESLKDRTVSPRAMEPRSPLARTGASGTETPPPTSSRLMHAEFASRPISSSDDPNNSNNSTHSTASSSSSLSGTAAAAVSAPPEGRSGDSHDPPALGGSALASESASASGPPPASPSSASAVAPSATTTPSKKSNLNPHAKEFKLNPNAKVFTPGTTAGGGGGAPFSTGMHPHPHPHPAAPHGPGGGQGSRPGGAPVAVEGSPVFVHAGGHPPGVMAQGMPMPGIMGGPFVPGSPGQHMPPQQYNAMAAASFMQQQQQQGGGPPAAFGVPGGPPVLQGQPGMKMPPHSPQVMSPGYVQQPGGMRGYPPQGPPMQGGPFIYPGGQQMMYPQGQVVFMQPVPQMMAGQQMGPPQQPGPHQQGPQQKHRGGPGVMAMQHMGGVQPFMPGQQPPMVFSHGPHHGPPPGSPMHGPMQGHPQNVSHGPGTPGNAGRGGNKGGASN